MIIEDDTADAEMVKSHARSSEAFGARIFSERACTAKERLDINDAIEEVVILTQSEVRRKKVALRTELAANLSPVMGDQVQLQQVVVNLILNAIEAMSTVQDRERDLLIRTQRGEGDEVRVAVRDSGIGSDLNIVQSELLAVVVNCLCSHYSAVSGQKAKSGWSNGVRVISTGPSY